MIDKILITIYTMVIFLYPEAFKIFNLTYSKILFVLSLLILGYNFIKNKIILKEKNLKYVISPLLLMSLLIFISNLFLSINTKQILLTNLYEVLRPLLYIFVFLIYYIYFKRNKEYLIKLMLALTGVVCIVGITQYFNLFNLNELYIKAIAPTQYKTLINGYSNPRIIGLTSNPNVYAFFLTLTSLITIYFIFKNKKKFYLYLLLILQKLNLYMTLSRTGFICFVIGELILIFLYFAYKRKLLKSIIICICVIILEIILVFVLPDKLTRRIKELSNLGGVNSWQERVDNNEYFKDNIINFFDGKLENYIYIMIGHGPEKTTTNTVYDNEYYMILYRYGFLGLMMTMVMFGNQILIFRNEKKPLLISSIIISLIYMYPAGIFHSYKLFVLLMVLWAFCYEKSNLTNKKSNKKSVLYINYVDFNNQTSGSSVRPKMIFDAFKEKGYEVKMLTGASSKKTKKQRLENIKEISKWLDFNTVDYCYIESGSGAIYLNEDRNLIEKIHEKGIKIGFFYRDIYYKFSKEIVFNNEKINIFSKKYLKDLYHKFQSYRDNLLIKKCVDVVFLPSESMKKYFSFNKMIALPPAGKRIKLKENKNKKSILYVGGVSLRYGTNLLLESMKKVNEKQFVELILICREKEKSFIDKKYLNEKWLKIYHISGEKNLAKYYNLSKLSIVPILKCEYNDFAVSVKLYEYMSYNLPIISTDCNEHKRIIEDGNIGVVCSCDVFDMAEKILDLYNDEEKINNLRKNMVQYLNEKNLWIHRIEAIEESLLKV